MMKAVFLDKDGTLIRDVPYNVDPDLMEWADGAREGVRALARAGYKLFVVTNQPGVALGLFRLEALYTVEEKLRDMFCDLGATIAGFYFCPHHPRGVVPEFSLHCLCRKPRPGLLHSAARDFPLDMPESWFVGDILNDIEAGNLARCRTILLNVGSETEWVVTPPRKPHFIASDLAHAAKIILREARP